MTIVDDDVLAIFRALPACEKCGRRVWPLDAHHAFRKRGVGGGSRLDVRCQIAGLCRICHTSAESSKPVEREVQEIVAKREGTTVQAIHDYLDLLLRTPKEQPIPRPKWGKKSA